MKPQVEGLTPGNTNGVRADAEAPALPPRHHDSGAHSGWTLVRERRATARRYQQDRPCAQGRRRRNDGRPRGAKWRPNSPECRADLPRERMSALTQAPLEPLGNEATFGRARSAHRNATTEPGRYHRTVGHPPDENGHHRDLGVWPLPGTGPAIAVLQDRRTESSRERSGRRFRGSGHLFEGSGFRGSGPPFEGFAFRGSGPPVEGSGFQGTGPSVEGSGFQGSGPPSKGSALRGSGSPFEGSGFRGSGPPFEGFAFRGSGPPVEGSGFQETGPPVEGSGFQGSGPPSKGSAFRGSGSPFEGSGFRGAGPSSKGSDFRGPGPPVEGLGSRRGGPPVGGPGRTRSSHANQPTTIGPTGLERVSQRRPGAPRRLLPATPLGPPRRVTRPIGEGSGGSEATSCPGSWSGSAETLTDPGSPVIRMLRSGRRRRPLTSSNGAVGGTNDTHGSEGSPRTAPGPGAGYAQDGHSHSASPVPAGTQTEPRSRSSYSSLQLLPPRATMAPVHQSAPQVPVRPQTQQNHIHIYN